MFKTGDQVFDIREGWGVVREVKDVSKGVYPVVVDFYEDTIEYTQEGKQFEDDNVAMLRKNEYRLCDIAKTVGDAKENAG